MNPDQPSSPLIKRISVKMSARDNCGLLMHGHATSKFLPWKKKRRRRNVSHDNLYKIVYIPREIFSEENVIRLKRFSKSKINRFN